jgi:hypothetical protein
MPFVHIFDLAVATLDEGWQVLEHGEGVEETKNLI